MHLLEYQSTLVIHSPVPEKTFQGGAAKKCDLCLLAVCNRCHILSLFISASSQDFQLELGRQWPFRFSSQQRQHWIRQRPLATRWKDILLRPNIQSDKSHSLLAKIHSLAQDCRRCWCQSVLLGWTRRSSIFGRHNIQLDKFTCWKKDILSHKTADDATGVKVFNWYGQAFQVFFGGTQYSIRHSLAPTPEYFISVGKIPPSWGKDIHSIWWCQCVFVQTWSVFDLQLSISTPKIHIEDVLLSLTQSCNIWRGMIIVFLFLEFLEACRHVELLMYSHFW